MSDDIEDLKRENEALRDTLRWALFQDSLPPNGYGRSVIPNPRIRKACELAGIDPHVGNPNR